MLKNQWFQSPIDKLFELGDWNSFYINKHDWFLRKEILRIIDMPECRINLYGLLHEFLKSNHRLALYLPFNILPHINEYKIVHENVDNFIDSYINAIYILEDYLEPVCNYTDGDIQNTELICPVDLIRSNLKNIGYINDGKHYEITNKYYDLYSSKLNSVDFNKSESILDFIYYVNKIKSASFVNEDKSRIKWLQSELHSYAMSDLINISNGKLNPSVLRTYFTQDVSKTIDLCDFKSKITDLHGLIYDTCIFYGSRFNCYEVAESDYDCAVIVRDDVDESEASSIDDVFGFSIYKFFSKKFGDLIDIVEHSSFCGKTTDSHILFNGYWFCCDNDLIKKILKPIVGMYDHTEQLERSALQYRLLHKGFRRHNFCSGPVFLNDDYRILASKLYLRKVLTIYED